MKSLTASGILAAAAIALALAAPASAQAPVEIKSSTPQQPKQFEIVVPGGPTTREKSRVPDADFYGEDQRVPYDPALVEPFVGTTKNGSKYGASLWTAPQTPVGSLASQGYGQGGAFGFGFTFIWDSGPAPTARPAAAPTPAR
jgi:hypothetical protein